MECGNVGDVSASLRADALHRLAFMDLMCNHCIVFLCLHSFTKFTWMSELVVLLCSAGTTLQHCLHTICSRLTPLAFPNNTWWLLLGTRSSAFAATDIWLIDWLIDFVWLAFICVISLQLRVPSKLCTTRCREQLWSPDCVHLIVGSQIYH